MSTEHTKKAEEAKSTLLTGEATEQQINEWKKANPLGIFAVKKDGRIAYFKNPSFDEINFYHSTANTKGNISDQWQALADVTFLGGCDELIKSPRYLPNVSKKLQDNMIGEEAELVNL